MFKPLGRKIVVFYHADCMDGYGAAMAFMRNCETDNVVYRKAHYGFINRMDISEVQVLNDSVTHIVFLDICPNTEVLNKLGRAGFKVLVLDHHETAKGYLAEVKNNPMVGYVMADNLSGASLVYSLGTNVNKLLGSRVDYKNPSRDYYFGNIKLSTNLTVEKSDLVIESNLNKSRLYRLLEVRDLWIVDDPEIKAQADYLASYFKHHKVASLPVDNNSPILSIDIDSAINEGKMIDDVHREMIRLSQVSGHRSKQFTKNGKAVELLIGQCLDRLGSLYGDVFNSQYPCSVAIAMYFNVRGNNIGISVRSNNKLARKIAEHLGGGGHDNSGGACIDLNTTKFDNRTFIKDIEKIIRESEI